MITLIHHIAEPDIGHLNAPSGDLCLADFIDTLGRITPQSTRLMTSGTDLEAGR